MKITAVLVFTALFLTLGTAFAGISIPYGEKDGQVAYYNQNNHPDAEELNPLGPMSFRVSGGEFWVADSLGSRIFRLGADGKVLAAIPLPKAEGDLLEDFALERNKGGLVSSILVISAANQEIIRVSLDGKVMNKYGGRGDDPGKFLQLYRIEVGPSGRFYVCDKGRQVLSVFSPIGALVREVHWEWSGFCLDPAENLCYLKWDESEKINHLLIENLEGKLVKEILLKIGDHVNPDLWFVNSSGEAILTFVPPEGFKGTYKIARCGSNGEPSVVTDLVPPIAMNRYIDQTEKGDFFIGVGNFGDAPKGSFKIEPYTLR